MVRRVPWGVAAALLAAPTAVCAQTWPTGAVTTTVFRAAQPAVPAPDAALGAPAWREPTIQEATPPSAQVEALPVPIMAAAPTLRALKPAPPAPLPLLPDIRIPAKGAWTDDQGFTVHYAELRYRQRF